MMSSLVSEVCFVLCTRSELKYEKKIVCTNVDHGSFQDLEKLRDSEELHWDAFENIVMITPPPPLPSQKFPRQYSVVPYSLYYISGAH